MSQIFHYQNEGLDRNALEMGATFDRYILIGTENSAGVFTPTNLTGREARLQVRDKAGTLILEFKKSDSTALIVGVSGRINLLQSAVVTAALTAGFYFYDLEHYDPANLTDVIRELEGNFIIVDEVTT